jgi:hypothetical protein
MPPPPPPPPPSAFEGAHGEDVGGGLRVHISPPQSINNHGKKMKFFWNNFLNLIETK